MSDSVREVVAAASREKRARVPITDPVEKRVEMINGMFDLPAETLLTMREIRSASDEFARRIQAAVSKVPHDTGRVIATIDLIQQLKNTACDAVILPHASKEVPM